MPDKGTLEGRMHTERYRLKVNIDVTLSTLTSLSCTCNTPLAPAGRQQSVALLIQADMHGVICCSMSSGYQLHVLQATQPRYTQNEGHGR